MSLREVILTMGDAHLRPETTPVSRGPRCRRRALRWRVLLGLAVCLGASGCATNEVHPRDWLTSAPLDLQAFRREATPIPETAFFEVRMTKLGTAVTELGQKCAVPLTDEAAVYYVGLAYRRKDDTIPYLVRGVFANYAGHYSLFWHAGSLLVQHDSFGNASHPMFCPLVVNLPIEPHAVIVILRTGR